MDTRIQKEEKGQPNTAQIANENQLLLAEDESIIRVDGVRNNESFLDSTIYNLCMKLQTQQQLEKIYYLKREPESSIIPKHLQNYVHHPCIIYQLILLVYIPLIAFPLLFMKFKKSWLLIIIYIIALTLNKALIVVCLATTFNEHYKYQKCMEADSSLAKEYQEYNANFSSLFGQLARSMTIRDVAQYIFQFDQHQSYLGSQSHYDRGIVEETNFNLY